MVYFNKKNEKEEGLFISILVFFSAVGINIRKIIMTQCFFFGIRSWFFTGVDKCYGIIKTFGELFKVFTIQEKFVFFVKELSLLVVESSFAFGDSQIKIFAPR